MSDIKISFVVWDIWQKLKKILFRKMRIDIKAKPSVKNLLKQRQIQEVLSKGNFLTARAIFPRGRQLLCYTHCYFALLLYFTSLQHIHVQLELFCWKFLGTGSTSETWFSEFVFSLCYLLLHWKGRISSIQKITQANQNLQYKKLF